MPTEPLAESSQAIEPGAALQIPAIEPRRVDPGPRAAEIDPVAALLEPDALAPDPLAAGGLAGQLLLWLAPRPRNPATLTQSRIVPLLGTASELLARAAEASGDIAGLGASALAQELRMHRTLADRRATLIGGGLAGKE